MHISTTPSLAILQGIICKNYYEKGVTDGSGLGFDGLELPTNFEDDRCKIGPVQSEVAEVGAWKDVFEILPGEFSFSFSFHFSLVSEREMKKRIL